MLSSSECQKVEYRRVLTHLLLSTLDFPFAASNVLNPINECVWGGGPLLYLPICCILLILLPNVFRICSIRSTPSHTQVMVLAEASSSLIHLDQLQTDFSALVSFCPNWFSPKSQTNLPCVPFLSWLFLAPKYLGGPKWASDQALLFGMGFGVTALPSSLVSLPALTEPSWTATTFLIHSLPFPFREASARRALPLTLPYFNASRVLATTWRALSSTGPFWTLRWQTLLLLMSL